ncbi:PP2C family protein-serine/threonine phosphatase [Mycoplasma procyoni]|uniref:PP2C family protein-serine/threonine phosphatase n=1 Tax=Mycoplasma procyoni TaxID=568784 RepID=UPI00197B4030|nr:protein phosphatase 2C domain-containing protein [Mycoplasma procyoni]MBN3534430.1 serine/threonine-protein phosphatase [Mycoplasma procyoni]
MKISTLVISEKGRRKNNEDNAIVLENERAILLILCDGMGGHEGGEYASKITVETFKEKFEDDQIPEDDADLRRWFMDGLSEANGRMKEFALKDYALFDMGTTFVSALFIKDENSLFFCNVGDSRAYLYSDYFYQITEDQNMLNFFINKQNMTYDEASGMPSAHYLTSSLGPKKTYEPVFSKYENVNNIKYIFLSSDGIHDYVQKPIMENILFQKDSNLVQKAQQLIQTAYNNNSSDNMTIAILEVE